MKLLAMWTVLSTLLPLIQISLAEPIPVEVRALGALASRSLTENLFGDDGSGPRYWAWARLAYDDDYNTNEEGRDLTGGGDKDWSRLDGDKIFVRGFAGPRVEGIAPWNAFTGMKVVVGEDSTNNVIVVSFIGSNDRPTFKQDFKFPLQSHDGIAGQVSKGFYQCYESVYKKAFEWAKGYADDHGDWDIVFTGHSLGGATAHVAAVAFVEMYPDLKDRITVFTYGAPRAGNLEFQEKLASNQGSRMANFRHHRDFIPFLPLINNVPGDQYANPARRWIFKPQGDGSWSNRDHWTEEPNANTDTRRFTGVVAVAVEIFRGAADHKNYFPNSRRTSRSIGSIEDDPASPLQKRDPPSRDDFRNAEGVIAQMWQSNELEGGEVKLTDSLEEFTESMGITNEKNELLEELSKLESEDDRVDFLKIVEIVAMEQ